MLINLLVLLNFIGVSKADVSLINKRLHKQLVDVRNDIEILRKDPKSPLFHVKSFEELNLYVKYMELVIFSFSSLKNSTGTANVTI